MPNGINPLCGDDYHLYVTVKDDIIIDIGFTGEGCAISKSVASMMTHQIKSKSVEDALKRKDAFIDMLVNNLDASSAQHLLNHLTLFENVREFPIRVKCATLIWRTLEAALLNKENKVSTE